MQKNLRISSLIDLHNIVIAKRENIIGRCLECTVGIRSEDGRGIVFKGKSGVFEESDVVGCGVVVDGLADYRMQPER